MSKKIDKIEPAVKLGGGSFNVAFVKSFKSKDKFVNDEKIRALVSFTKDIDDYLTSIWDKCHLEDELKTAEKLPEKSESDQENIPETTEIKKVATKRKSESKKE
jgi:hypothetical protein